MKIGIVIAIVAMVGIMGVLFASGIFEFNQENLDKSIQKISNDLPAVEEVPIIAKDTTDKLTMDTLTVDITEQVNSLKTKSEKSADTFEPMVTSVEIFSEHIGKTVEHDGIKYTLLSISKSKNSLGDGKTFSPATTVARDGAIFLMVKIKMENITTDIRSIPHEYGVWAITDDVGRNYKPATSDIPLHSQKNIGFQLRIPSGLSDVKSFGYEVLDEDSHYKMFILGTIT